MDTGESRSGFLPSWRLKTSGIIAPDERLPWGQTIVAGVQHVIAMFGATVLMPIVMGFDPNVAILFSGVGTILFFLIVGGRVPSYLGSSASFIGVVIAVTAYSGQGPNLNLPIALGGIVAAGALYTTIAVVVMVAGTRWIEVLMPPVVTGAVVAAIGLNLAPIAVLNLNTGFNAWMGMITVAAVGVVAVMVPGMLGRLPVLVGGIIGYLIYLVLANAMGLAPPVSFAELIAAPWFGLPRFEAPLFDTRVMVQMAPVAIILVAENLGHVKAIGAMVGRNLDPWLGRAFLGDGIATMVAGMGGGTGVTTYAENIGVMAVTRIYSTIVFVVAGVVAILLGFSPKFGALILTIPKPVLGGLSVVVFGLIAATAGRIWVQNRVDFSNPRNLITVGAAVTLGAGNLALPFGEFTLGGIGTATFGAIALYHLLREPEPAANAEAERTRDAA